MRKERLRVKGGTAAEKDIFLFFIFCGGGGVYSTYALQQLLINTTLQLTIQYMLHWIEAKDLRGFFGGGGEFCILELFCFCISSVTVTSSEN